MPVFHCYNMCKPCCSHMPWPPLPTPCNLQFFCIVQPCYLAVIPWVLVVHYLASHYTPCNGSTTVCTYTAPRSVIYAPVLCATAFTVLVFGFAVDAAYRTGTRFVVGCCAHLRCLPLFTLLPVCHCRLVVTPRCSATNNACHTVAANTASFTGRLLVLFYQPSYHSNNLPTLLHRSRV